MIFSPAILALFVGSLITTGLLVAAAFFGVQILRHWDLASGSELQLKLERQTYLVSTFVAYAFAFELLSLFLFIYTADQLHTFFVGAMCAAGSLNANSWGYPAIIFRIFNCLLAGTWLIVNYTDNKGYDYPLIRMKYVLLLVIAPFILAETVVQAHYFLGLEPEVITSCCGALFSVQGASVAADIIAFPRVPLEIIFAATMILVLAWGLYSYRTGQGGYVFAAAAFLAFLISLMSFISFISIYIYELPTHHCPFCVLQQEYFFIGYLYFLTLLAGTITGLGVGILNPYRQTASLQGILPGIQQKLILASLIFFGSFTAIAVLQIIFSNLRM
ncbi:MAG: hypothetical protein PHX53_11610 [Syntrophales bacterium]|nr:hypothetical protein [Syntrophales bacterium]